MEYEDFEREYRQHIPKAVPILKKYGATSYTIQFTSSVSKTAAIEALSMTSEQAAAVYLEHDAIATMYVFL
jgi:uncharacterized protein YbaA (DUF1428 family)